MFILPTATPSDGTNVNLSTTIPEFILDDNITLEGTIHGENVTLRHNTSNEFSGGSLHNVTVDSDTVLHKPELKWAITNGGDAILENSGSSAWDITLRGMDVVKVNSTYYLYYAGGSSWQYCHIGLATSTDGENWTKFWNNPVLRVRKYSGDPDQSYAAPVIYHDGTKFHLYYSRWDGFGLGIHYAYSDDGTNFTRYANNPVINHGPGTTSWNHDTQPACFFNDS
ncbi:MAG: hypothetical protein KAS77_05915, partial [Thermoplasmata archaeon]|nr:hypothetical protein [Thermoplasmata archaeon]